jgi:pyruvate dehydrogenase E2 component (dihydrolipoamide acetyltransferase)
VAVKVLMPKLGLTMTEGKIVRWIKQEGEPIKKGEPLLEVMTEKIVTEVESPGSGNLVKIFHFKDAVVPITEVIALIAEEGEDWAAEIAELEQSIPTVTLKEKDQESSQQIPAASMQKATADHTTRLKISPLARRIAKENGLIEEDLRSINGSGPLGRIVKKDVLAYLESGQRAKKDYAAASPQTSRTEPLTDLRSTIARRMTQSFTTTPHFYLETEVEADNLLQMRTKINEVLSNENESVSINDILVKITAAVIARHPYINSSYSDQGIVIHSQVNIGVAVALDSGLIVPVIKDASRKGLQEIALTSRGLIDKARSDNLSLDDISGGTFTLSNLGMFAVDAFTAIINPPEAAILAVGRVVEKPVLAKGELLNKRFIRLTVGLDHRVLDGAQGARFLGNLKAYIENPYLLNL